MSTSASPVMSDRRSGRFSQRARSRRRTVADPRACQPGTVLSSTRRARMSPPVDRTSSVVSMAAAGPTRRASSTDSTPIFDRPWSTPAHSWKVTRGASMARSSTVGVWRRSTRPSSVNSLRAVVTCKARNSQPSSPLETAPDSARTSSVGSAPATAAETKSQVQPAALYVKESCVFRLVNADGTLAAPTASLSCRTTVPSTMSMRSIRMGRPGPEERGRTKAPRFQRPSASFAATTRGRVSASRRITVP